MNSAHAEYVQARYPGVTLVRQPSTTMPRRSWAERYKARLRVDWQRWERMSMRTLVSAAVAANNRPSGASSSSDDASDASPLRVPRVQAGTSFPCCSDCMDGCGGWPASDECHNEEHTSFNTWQGQPKG